MLDKNESKKLEEEMWWESFSEAASAPFKNFDGISEDELKAGIYIKIGPPRDYEE